MQGQLPPAVAKALAKMEPAIRRAFEEAIRNLTSVAQVKLIEDALAAGDVQRAIAALRIDQTFFAPLDRAISEAFWQGGVTALAGLPRLNDPFPGSAWCWALMAAIHAQRNGQEVGPEI